MVFSNQNDAVTALQMVGPTDQDALVIPGEDNNDIYKINLPPACQSSPGQGKATHKLHIYINQSKGKSLLPTPSKAWLATW